MEFHPAADLFPLLDESSDSFAELVEDIRDNGLLQPILICNGQILDGRNRLRACQVAGVEPRYETWAGEDPYHRVISLNLHRRHLTRDQAAAIAVEAKPKVAEEVEKKRRAQQALTQSGKSKMMNSSSQPKTSKTTRHQLAETFETSEWKIEQAEQLQKSSTPEKLEEVKNGKISLNGAVKQSPPKRGPKPKLTLEDYGLDPRANIPGQEFIRRSVKPPATLLSRVREAVERGRGIGLIAEEVQTHGLDLDEGSIRALVDRLKSEARERTKLVRALETVLAQRGNPR